MRFLGYFMLAMAFMFLWVLGGMLTIGKYAIAGGLLAHLL